MAGSLSWHLNLSGAEVKNAFSSNVPCFRMMGFVSSQVRQKHHNTERQNGLLEQNV